MKAGFEAVQLSPELGNLVLDCVDHLVWQPVKSTTPDAVRATVERALLLAVEGLRPSELHVQVRASNDLRDVTLVVGVRADCGLVEYLQNWPYKSRWARECDPYVDPQW